MSDPSEATKKFAEWLNAGPALAKAAGCHVGIKVTAAKGGKIKIESGANAVADSSALTEAATRTTTTEGECNAV